MDVHGGVGTSLNSAVMDARVGSRLAELRCGIAVLALAFPVLLPPLPLLLSLLDDVNWLG